MTCASTSGSGRPLTRALLRCGAAAGPLFVAMFLVEGATRDGYRPLRHPVSSLALGPRGWIQTANFAATGALVLAGATGLARSTDKAPASAAAAALIGAAGAGLLASATFATDPVSGYPPGTPDALTEPTRRGTAHNLSAVPVFLGLPAAALTCAWRASRVSHASRAARHADRAFAAYSAGTALTMLATMVLASAGFGQSPPFVNVAGLLQRVSIGTGFAWLTAVSARALRRAASGDPAEAA